MRPSDPAGGLHLTARKPQPGIDVLTGIRSSKPTFYAEYRHTAESLVRSVQAIDHIANVLVATAQGPAELCRSVVTAAAEHVGAQCTVLALRPTRLPDAAVREMLLDGSGVVQTSLEHADTAVRLRVLSALVRRHEGITDLPDGTVVVPMTVDGDELGVLVACFDEHRTLEQTDLALLKILANQAAVALQSADLLARSERLHRRAATLYAAAERQAADLAERHRQLAEAQHCLDSALQREAIDDERHRIARELHDSVAQHVVSAGLTIEWCRGEVAEDSEVRQRLDHAKALTRSAVEQLRGAIYAITPTQSEPDPGLPELLSQLASLRIPSELNVAVRVEGRPVPLSGQQQQSLFRIASECVFNTSQHANARRVIVRLAYGTEQLRLSVADDGDGDPDLLRRLSTRAATNGYHRGLGNMVARATEMGGSLQFRRARLGGVRVQVSVPLPASAEEPISGMTLA